MKIIKKYLALKTPRRSLEDDQNYRRTTPRSSANEDRYADNSKAAFSSTTGSTNDYWARTGQTKPRRRTRTDQNNGHIDDANAQDFRSTSHVHEIRGLHRPLRVKKNTTNINFCSVQIDDADKHDLKGAYDVLEGILYILMDRVRKNNHGTARIRDDLEPSDPSGVPHAGGDDIKRRI